MKLFKLIIGQKSSTIFFVLHTPKRVPDSCTIFLKSKNRKRVKHMRKMKLDEAQYANNITVGERNIKHVIVS